MAPYFQWLMSIGQRDRENCKEGEEEEKGMRQVVEGVIGAVKSFNVVSRWRKGITLLCYVYAYSIAYSFFRRKNAG